MGLDRLVGLLPVHAHRAVDLNRCEQILREGFAITDVRDRADIADRLADVCEEQGRDEEAKEFRRQSERRATTVEVSRTVSSAGKVLRQKTQVNFGGAGLPLSELSNVAGMLRETPTDARHPAKGRAERAMPLRQRQEVQKVLRRLTRGLPRPASAKLISVAFAHSLPVPANSI